MAAIEGRGEAMIPGPRLIWRREWGLAKNIFSFSLKLG